ncbi:MAG: ribonuclease P protein component [Patescibacteria group bacterium]
MLEKPHRLLTNYEFNKTRRKGVKFSNPLFDMYYLRLLEEDNATRFGIVVSNKFSKVAPTRNRVKRLFREAIRNNFDRIKSGYWVVIYPRKESIEKGYEEISSEYVKALQNVPFSW